MTTATCGVGHAVLVPVDTDFRAYRCPECGLMDRDAARLALEDLQHVNEEIRREDLMPEMRGGKR